MTKPIDASRKLLNFGARLTPAVYHRDPRIKGITSSANNFIDFRALS